MDGMDRKVPLGSSDFLSLSLIFTGFSVATQLIRAAAPDALGRSRATSLSLPFWCRRRHQVRQNNENKMGGRNAKQKKSYEDYEVIHFIAVMKLLELLMMHA